MTAETRHVALDPMRIVAVGVAMKQHFRIEPCAQCGGPEVFSKTLALSRCFRCGARREHPGVRQHKVSWRRCALCHAPAMAGVPLSKRYCRACQSLSQHERSKRLRWQSERLAETVAVPQESPMKSGSSEAPTPDPAPIPLPEPPDHE